MELSIQATRKVKQGRPLGSTIRLNLPRALEGLGSFFSPVVSPDEPVDLMSTYVLQQKKMEWCRQEVIRTDLAHQTALGKLAKYIKRRGKLTSSLYDQLVSIRRICLGVLSDEEFVELGLDGVVSQDPDTMLRQGMKVRGGFTQPDLELESPGWVRMKMEAGSLLGDLDSTVEDLDAVLDKLSDLRRIVQGEAAAKRKALDDFDENYLLIGRSVEACFRMAGMLPEAERVREASRRLTRSSNEVEPVPEEVLSATVEEESEESEETEAGSAPADSGPSADAQTAQTVSSSP